MANLQEADQSQIAESSPAVVKYALDDSNKIAPSSEPIGDIVLITHVIELLNRNQKRLTLLVN
jgi:hypothetical protein